MKKRDVFLFLFLAIYVGLFCFLGIYASPYASDDYVFATLIARHGFWRAQWLGYTLWFGRCFIPN